MKIIGPSLLFFFMLSLLGSVSSDLSAQTGLPPAAGTRGQALGGVGITFQDAHAAWTNPAGLASLKQVGVNLSGEQRFSLSELQLFNLGVAVPLAGGGLGLTLNSFGYSSLRENRVSVVYGRSLGPNFRIGGEIIGFNTSVEGYDSRFAATFGFGMQVDLLPELTVGVRAFSPFRVELVPDEDLPQLLAAGLAYQPNDKITLLAEVHQDLDLPARFRGGLEYNFSEVVDLRFGVATGPAQLSFGAGFRATPTLQIEVAASYHETLGLSPGVGIVYTGQ
ncbi:MAG: hypothetical protein AAFQ37_06000 [Bacteroidota bacterium]